jgi:outer membrane protein assembly factor BamB
MIEAAIDATRLDRRILLTLSLGRLLLGHSSRTSRGWEGTSRRALLLAALAVWPFANGDLAGRRAAPAHVSSPHVLWHFRLPPSRAGFGSITATPVIVGRTVYVQDSSSSVYALDARTGRLRWKHRFAAPNDGPNGVAVVDSRVYAATDTTAFALDRRTGRLLWTRRLVNRFEQFISIAPVVDRGRVYLSTVGFPPAGHGSVYALSARTGRVLWRFQTILEPWPHTRAGGGGAWYPVSVDARGDVYVGNSNPEPWGGTKRFPNGAIFGGPALYTDSLLVLDGATGRLRWYDQVTRHDVRDYDFQATPVLARNRVFGAGKAGRVVAWNRTTHARVWSRAVGTHLNDLGPLRRRLTTVCPGLLGGVLTPMAYARGRLFVPVVELCSRESALITQDAFARPPAEGKGVVYALDASTGKTVWRRQLRSAPFGCATVAGNAVVVPTYDGRSMWRTRLPARNNSCPAVGRGVLVVGAGVQPGSPQVVAFRLSG